MSFVRSCVYICCFCRVWTLLPQLGLEKWSGHGLCADPRIVRPCIVTGCVVRCPARIHIRIQYTYTYTYTYHMHIPMRIRMHVYMYTHIHIYVYLHRHRHRHLRTRTRARRRIVKWFLPTFQQATCHRLINSYDYNLQFKYQYNHNYELQFNRLIIL